MQICWRESGKAFQEHLQAPRGYRGMAGGGGKEEKAFHPLKKHCRGQLASWALGHLAATLD